MIEIFVVPSYARAPVLQKKSRLKDLDFIGFFLLMITVTAYDGVITFISVLKPNFLES